MRETLNEALKRHGLEKSGQCIFRGRGLVGPARAHVAWLVVATLDGREPLGAYTLAEAKQAASIVEAVRNLEVLEWIS